MEISISFILFVMAAAFTPGPNNIMIMASGLNYGVRASVPHLLGIALGVPVMFLATGLVLSYVFEKALWFHTAIQVFGIAYLCYLAWLIWRAAPALDDGGREGRPLTFVQAALFQWVNPKAWMMGTGSISAFSTVGGDVSREIPLMALVFFLMAIPSAGTWLFFGAGLKRLFTNPKHLLLFNKVMALVLLLAISPVLIELFGRYFAAT